MTRDTTDPTFLCLKGVDHTARPTWKLKETVEFYRDILGLPLVHTISARGWGPETHPDFLHFFFDSGKGSTIAFFYYLGSEAPPEIGNRPRMRPAPDDHVFDATHTSWLVDGVDELRVWKRRLEAKGVEVSAETTHEVIESIYFRDPNGYFIEITRKLRSLIDMDAVDAELTLEAAIQLEEEAKATGGHLSKIDPVWNRKAQIVREGAHERTSTATIGIFVLDVPEFSALLAAARRQPSCRVSTPVEGYHLIESSGPVEFRRKELGLKPAVWYGLFTGGLKGRIETFDRDLVRIVPAD